jgi:hypothetical protein
MEEIYRVAAILDVMCANMLYEFGLLRQQQILPND